MRILVIDDEAAIRELICRMLEAEGFDTLQAGNGNEGLEMVRNEPDVAVVICDLVMPEKEGLETIKEIRAEFPNIRVLAISGGGRGDAEDYLAFSKAFGAEATLKKPFRAEELLKAVRGLIPNDQ